MAEKVVDEAIEEAGGLLNRLTDMEVGRSDRVEIP